MATPQDVQFKLDEAVSYLKGTTSSYSQMVKKYGSDWSKWPANSKWYLALTLIAAAKAEAGSLGNQLIAGFSYKES